MFEPIKWGKRVDLSFPNTAIYPPFFYLPASCSLVIVKWLNFDVLRTSTVMRVATALASVAMSSIAISIAGSAGLWLFSILLLPASAMLMSAVSQDGPMLASAAVATAVVLRLCDPQSIRWRWKLVLLSVVVAALGMARPPYIAMVVLPLVTERPPLHVRWIATLTCVGLIMTWWALCGTYVMVSTDPAQLAHPAQQFLHILLHPGILPALIGTTFQTNFLHDYAGYFISPLELPLGYHVAAWCVLAAAVMLSICAIGPAKRAVIVIISVLAACAGIFVIQYLTWTPVGAPMINGVLGRYFLPLAVILGACFTSQPGSNSRLRNILKVPVLTFPVISIVLVAHRIATRYYLQ